MPTDVPKVLLGWVRVGIDDGVLVEHLPVALVPRQVPEVGDLVLDLGLDAAEALGELRRWEPAALPVAVEEASSSLVLRHDSLPVLPMAWEVLGYGGSVTLLLPEGRLLLRITAPEALASASLPDTLTWVTLHRL